MSDSPEPRRRNLLVMVIYGLGALMCLGLAAPAAVYLLLPPRPCRESEWTEAADSRALARQRHAGVQVHT